MRKLSSRDLLDFPTACKGSLFSKVVALRHLRAVRLPKPLLLMHSRNPGVRTEETEPTVWSELYHFHRGPTATLRMINSPTLQYSQAIPSHTRHIGLALNKPHAIAL